VGERLDVSERDEAVGQQAGAPASVSLRRCAAGQRDQVRLTRPIELGGIRPLGRARVERQVEPLLHEEQAEAAYRARAHVQRPGDLLIRPAGATLIRPAGATRRDISLEQDARVRYLARRRFPAAGHLL